MRFILFVLFGILLFGCTHISNQGNSEDKKLKQDSSRVLQSNNLGNVEKQLSNNLFLKSCSIVAQDYILKIGSI